MGERLTEVFMQLFSEKNSDGTRNLVLKGKDLWQRIHTRLHCQDMFKISSFLQNNKIIVKLDLCYNEIGDKGVELLVDHYLSNEGNTLAHLNLGSCGISHKAVESLLTASSTLKLKSLRLNGNKLGFKGGVIVSQLLGASTTLLHLDVGETDQTLATVQYFMQVMRDDIGTINKLRIFDFSRLVPMSKHYQYDPSHLAESVGEMLKVNPYLSEIHLQKNGIDGHDIELLLLGVKLNKTLKFLDLGFNNIGDHGIELIARWLSKRPPLLALNVAGNGIGDTGARALSFGMPFSKLRMLDITNNRIKNGGIIDILNSLKKPYVMRYLFIWGNDFDHKTLVIIERMLLSTVLVQEQIDVKLYTVDDVIYAAYYPSNHYKHRYYCVMDHGCPVELKIKRNRMESRKDLPHAKLNLHYYDRYPPVNPVLPPDKRNCVCQT
ncbi:hypothetical protein PPYR_09053 [Photinus pyralis]|uniref:Leucine-rich repeat-containing protein 34 n=1 Tax=Photinus pyralis TaxID=7054 RepID=A0A5N4AL43_PHOPY|nr:leucine-rich repeat-containing protein 34-like [Photinus pyralis]KAB0798060.1 hypothetical protein PPYR_09053 [Photinus pyralis]